MCQGNSWIYVWKTGKYKSLVKSTSIFKLWKNLTVFYDWISFKIGAYCDVHKFIECVFKLWRFFSWIVHGAFLLPKINDNYIQSHSFFPQFFISIFFQCFVSYWILKFPPLFSFRTKYREILKKFQYSVAKETFETLKWEDDTFPSLSVIKHELIVCV